MEHRVAHKPSVQLPIAVMVVLDKDLLARVERNAAHEGLVLEEWIIWAIKKDLRVA